MPGIKIKSKTAFKVIRGDRQRFNLDIHAGHWGEMGPGVTHPGATGRVFEVVDMQALYVYSRMIDRGMKSDRAARIASLILEALEKSDAKADTVDVIRLMSGGLIVTYEQSFEDKLEGDPVESHETWNMAAIRDHILGLIQEEEIVVGDDD